jgi:hypothetical protein
VGAVQIETYNFRLMNIADYSNKVHVKNLLRNYFNLYELFQCGDSVAAAIYVDLTTVLEPKNYVMTDMQWDCVVNYFLLKKTLKDIAEMKNRDESSIKYCIERAITRIQTVLENGTLYEKRD